MVAVPPPLGGSAGVSHRLGGPPALAGVVHLVGAGPGDPGLLTLRAAQLLATSTFIAHDRLATLEALELAPPEAVRVPVGKRRGGGWRQEEIERLIIDAALAGHAVVRLKGGDPFVLGRGGEEALACAAAGIPFEVVPGVTSAIAAPAAAGVPVTHRGVASGFAVITGHEDPTKPETDLDWSALAAFPGTLVILMGVVSLATTVDRLIANGRSAATPAAAVRWATTPLEEVVEAPLGQLPQAVARAGLKPPATIIIGDVVALRAQLAETPSLIRAA
ncbi:MAG TPA: uroporphyrinogen-III C-methyltransferase [Nitriliruptorales bacterium]|nr:uroporphyrinogen-III C-methyltransferase [Nitriliruptorales bacterium]